jgi:biopolymer transport protein ExbD
VLRVTIFRAKALGYIYKDLIKDRSIEKAYIQADKTTSYDNVLQLMVFLKNQGHENIGLVFDQNE